MPIGYRGASGGYLIEPQPVTDVEPRRDASGELTGYQDGAVRKVPDEAATIRAIRRVAGIIGDDALGDECIADLPAEELT